MSNHKGFNKSLLGILVATGASFMASEAEAAAFETCPSKAYLFQANPVQVYGVNLVTGQTALLQGDTGLNTNINAVGFDFDSRYIYGYDTGNKQIVRLGDNFQAEVLNTVGLPTDHTFYVGDVINNVYYLYRQGKGLFKIDLAPLDDDPSTYLVVEQISNTASVRLTDFAFHPGDEELYGIDNGSGILYRFNTTTGAATAIGDTGVTGTFGAGYFDVNGNYYVSRNNDGNIYRVDLSDPAKIAEGIVPAVKFANGPSSSQNDGARCANAPIIDEDSMIDFGDAPDSYLTTLMNNGPRHQLDGITYLGNQAPDGEQDGLIAPLSDDTTGIADESGVGFVTAIEPGLDSIVSINASTQGYLSAWFDWNQDGDFDDEGEKVFSDVQLSAGLNALPFTVDYNAVDGRTWTRFRFSQQQGLDYFGGATSGEVEDHPINVSTAGITIRHFPSETGYATLAYEDNWPYTADYDMNDVVMHYRVTEVLRDNQVEKSLVQGRLAAVGADYHNGFAVRLQGILQTDVDALLTRQYHNGVLLEDNGLELDSNEAIFIIDADLTDYKTNTCSFFRTQAGCVEDENFSFELHITLDSNSDRSNLMAMPYDPFIFATPGYYHGEGLPFQPGRQWEVHLADYAPTEKFNGDAMFNLGVDASNPEQGTYFKTDNNLPWALLMTEEWRWPLERTDLVHAYPEFAEYAESGGQQKTTWHKRNRSDRSKIYDQ
ncbi:LruC domain-containing protein [Vibrio breoganii]|uniref:LruC domain-containing protein n=1 Tax=Vibrio breoganii TaxID=553239 RepID=UPI000C8446F2|nr:LruC domain-containing protein [Vibrio breoganii]PMG41139.1 LruC domain-containing protein [Vibrio breoganii]PMM00344.1 LruC domain-containing protein [Vibrio breoganii]PMN62945.1 LruC domain-containing protein [Vibrio breoganii]TKG33103.1 LruC domain-containing protein [Vibrio breoganii]